VVKRARVACLAVVAVVCTAATPGVARAHDSLAPAGASHNWLPSEEWIHRHWIPFDERALHRALGFGPHELRAYLYNDHHTLADLARRRGWDPEALAASLVAPWQGISPEHRALLGGRTMRILTQGHLAQHVFFHVFHGLVVHAASDHLFGVSGHDSLAMRAEGHSYVEIAEHGNAGTAALYAGVAGMIDSDHRDGIARLEAWPRQSDRIRDRTRAQLACWVQQPPAAMDPANPFGKNRFLHGEHAAGWPNTAEERRANDRRVERFRLRLVKGCWRHPRSWSEPSHERTP